MVEQLTQIFSISKISKYCSESSQSLNTVLTITDDDGEPGTSTHLLNHLKSFETVNFVLVAARWFGEIHLSFDRFTKYTDCY